MSLTSSSTRYGSVHRLAIWHAVACQVYQAQSSRQAIFLYIGAIMPWNEFGNFEQITPWRLVVLGILVMLVRRLPWVVLLVRSQAPRRVGR